MSMLVVFSIKAYQKDTFTHRNGIDDELLCQVSIVRLFFSSDDVERSSDLYADFIYQWGFYARVN